MRHLASPVSGLLLALSLATAAAIPAQTQITVQRDEHGFPHVTAPDEESAYYGLGYMQALDLRADLMLKLALTSGRANKSFSNAILGLAFPGSAPRAHIFGPDHLPTPSTGTLRFPTLLDIDKTLRLYRYLENARLIWLFMRPQDRRNLIRFTQGINDAIAENAHIWVARGDFRYPELAALGLFDFEVKPTDVIQNTLDLFTTFMVLENQNRIDAFHRSPPMPQQPPVFGPSPTPPPQWPEPGTENPPPDMGQMSNQWAFRQVVDGRYKTAHIIDPHVPLFDIRFIFYSFQLRYPGGMVAGTTVPGFPMMIFGTTDHIAWSHTAHGDQTKTNWIIQVDPNNPDRYRTSRTFGFFVPFLERTFRIENQAGGFDEFKTFWSTHGRLLAKDPTAGSGLTFRIAKRGRFNVIRQYYEMARARDIHQAIRAMSQLALPTFNTVITDDSNLFYVFNALLARRDESVDWRGPVDAMDPATEWRGLHRFSELPQVLNPESGFLINMNVSPTEVTPDPGFELGDFPNYMIDYAETPFITYRHQSAQRVVAERFDPGRPLTRNDLFAMATDTRSFYYPELYEKLQATFDAYTGDHPPFPALSPFQLAVVQQELAFWRQFVQNEQADTVKTNTIQPRMEIYRFLLRLLPEAAATPEISRLANGNGRFDSTQNQALADVDSFFALKTVFDTITTATALGFTPQTTWGQVHVLDNFVARFPVNGGGFSLRATDPSRFDGQFVMDGGQSWVQTVEHAHRGEPLHSFFQKAVWGPLDPLVPWINVNSQNFSLDRFESLYVEPGALNASNVIETRQLTVPRICNY